MEFDIAALTAQAQEIIVAWGIKILGAIGVYVVGWIIARSVHRGLTRLFRKTEFDETIDVGM